MNNNKSIIGKRIMYALLLIIIALFILMIIVFPPSSGKIKNPDNDAVCEKTFLDVNGTKLGMIINGAKKENPVLLFLGGGPGIPEYWLEYEYPTDIDKLFTVCYLCYRGTALSFDTKLSPETMTPEQFVNDAVQVTDYLRERFSQEKIYLIGHSFGTTIALQLANDYPEKYEAYIGMGMSVDKSRPERMPIIICSNNTKKPTTKKWLLKWNNMLNCSAFRTVSLICPMKECIHILLRPVIKPCTNQA